MINGIKDDYVKRQDVCWITAEMGALETQLQVQDLPGVDIPQWVSVENRLPEPYEVVLACCDYNQGKRVQRVTYYDGADWMCPYPVTHWMPLPVLPATNSEDE